MRQTLVIAEPTTSSALWVRGVHRGDTWHLLHHHRKSIHEYQQHDVTPRAINSKMIECCLFVCIGFIPFHISLVTYLSKYQDGHCRILKCCLTGLSHCSFILFNAPGRRATGVQICLRSYTSAGHGIKLSHPTPYSDVLTTRLRNGRKMTNLVLFSYNNQYKLSQDIPMLP